MGPGKGWLQRPKLCRGPKFVMTALITVYCMHLEKLGINIKHVADKRYTNNDRLL